MSTIKQEIKENQLQLVSAFATNPRSKDESLALLRKFRDVLSESFDPIADAIKQDFNKPKLEVYLTEYSQIISEMSNIISQFDSMMEASSNPALPIAFATLKTHIEKIALGTVLIISPFNYPLILTLSPFVGAIAAGNNVVIKLPYDQLPNFSTVLKKLIESIFPKDQVMVVNGGIEESQTLLNECKFDKIFFTGSTHVGKIVYKAASENLTPVVLELGGKSPVFITENLDLNSLNILVDRLLWGKFTNAGQTCVAPDYVLVHEKVYKPFMETLLKRFNSTYKDVGSNSDFSHIINESGFNRLTSLLGMTKGKILTGGNSNRETLFIEPTIIENIKWDDAVMKEELFGPILPIIQYNSSLRDVINKVTADHDCPLAAYLFSSSNEDLTTLRTYLRSGSISINETLLAAGCFIAPFGGIGKSGMGNYHSNWTIDAFTHERTIIKQPIWAEPLVKIRYFPYTVSNFKTAKKLEIIPDIPIKKLKKLGVCFLLFLLGWILGKKF